jgi:hypothetical protein
VCQANEWPIKRGKSQRRLSSLNTTGICFVDFGPAAVVAGLVATAVRPVESVVVAAYWLAPLAVLVAVAVAPVATAVGLAATVGGSHFAVLVVRPVGLVEPLEPPAATAVDSVVVP